MSRRGLPSIDRLSNLPADLSKSVRQVTEIGRNTALLRGVLDVLKQVAADTAALPGIREVPPALTLLGGALVLSGILLAVSHLHAAAAPQPVIGDAR